MNIKVIAFDADDTLWVNEPYFQEVEQQFCALLEDYLPQHAASKELFKVEMQNLALYGYGVKAYILSMIEATLSITKNTAPPQLVEKIIACGKALLQKPIELLEGVEEVLQALSGSHRLVVATKGDLLDQERKLKRSGIDHYFHHTEIMSDKQEADYLKLVKHLDIMPEEFLMIGNSIKSDILPVLAIGAHAFHVPYHVTWEHEKVIPNINDPEFKQLDKITEILTYLR
jgi:putative hydrolase of the HAD superfamily